MTTEIDQIKAEPETAKVKEFPALCSQCGVSFDAWGWTLHQRDHGRVYCGACCEGSLLKAIQEKQEIEAK